MKTIGLIGGMSWESSAEYYRLINQATRTRLGGQHNAPSLMLTVDFAPIEALQAAGDWDTLGERMAQAARQLEAGGAECVVLCTNTMHKLAPQIETATRLPLLHIADATADAIKAAGFSRAGLLGTRFTMEQDFYRGRLEQRHGLSVLLPEAAERDTVHHVIYQELCQGVIRDASRDAYRRIIDGLFERGAQCVILGCTEIGLLIQQADTALPVFDTTRLHAEAAVAWSLVSEPA
ncbi:MAG: aspartate/glutamate racemase family protein [Paludibacterium sp.]|uniref:aspartate/glutamate racemase family protein n=1 Tax=Paludibacterium sp. TaxID=1917523 RepID=UPI0025D13321|nr:aspartate/glutamate racemase family protein [Paludibacterium sp.]MBV8046051.1 aspartate/glutamate racemase family protein [Paludibacterium sp.]MBV8646140.1 aspartate/glutamate racemase family protein [Paludibacterium sp.]